ncbi:hypothetical protein [Caulobacter hibisci]|uniref:Uncharacterized protein n=1 Tax=Caulobacter hibisci TaxID=2035993 RepID=A0ABS0SZQ5_9CAUL|nr:hypothetical protein [Caulobacter hibisci]MBI1684067.1 hypothetical protein [Caulobacter hibisci]
MTIRAVHTQFNTEIARLNAMIGGPADHARFLFDDLAAEAGFVSTRYRVPFCMALRSALTAFQIDYAQSADTALAHTAACARLEVIALLAGRS